MTGTHAGTRSEQDPYDPDDDLVAEYDVRSPLARTLLTVAGTLGALLVLGLVVVGVSYATTSERTESTSFDAAELSSLRVAGGASDIRVRTTTDAEVSVTARVSEGLVGTDYSLERTADGLAVSSSCHRWLVPGCGVEITLEVPEGLPVELRTTSGDISLDGVGGFVVARTTSGDVEATDLTTVDFDATTVSGDVDLAFAEQPSGLKARTGSGDVAVEIPDGGLTYAVTTTNESGDVENGLQDDPDGTGFITLQTDSGDIELDGP